MDKPISITVDLNNANYKLDVAQYLEGEAALVFILDGPEITAHGYNVDKKDFADIMHCALEKYIEQFGGNAIKKEENDNGNT